MIYSALNTIALKINEYLKLKFTSNGEHLEICNLLEQDGALATTDTNKVIASVINLQRETSMGISPKMEFNNNGRYTQGKAPVFMNIYVLFTSIYTGKNYPEGLKFLSSIIEFIQGNSTLDHQNTPQLSSKIEKLSFELVSLDMNELSQMWGAIGGKCMPSVLYKVRMLTFDQGIIQAEIQSVENPNTKAKL